MRIGDGNLGKTALTLPAWVAAVLALLLSAFWVPASAQNFKVQCPTHSPEESDLWQVAGEISRRLIHIFLRDSSGRRPVAGGLEIFQNDPHWKDLILFHEYFHGDNGAGLGASHQTGWTGLVAKLIEQSGE